MTHKRFVTHDLCHLAFAMALTIMTVVPIAIAQPNSNQGVPNALQGFSQNRGQPVQIEAASLEVRDKDKIATFTGNVKVIQGDTTLRCKSLIVFYEQQAKPAGTPTMTAATPGPGGSSQISRLEARGGVTVTQKEQTATGDTGLFDMKSNTVTLQGNVVVSQGQNVMRGERLVVDLVTGVSRVDSGKAGGPVRMLIHQGTATPGGVGPGSGSSSSPNTGSKPGSLPGLSRPGASN
jgi:lipopolysaccharide export system protein LptA